MSRPSSTRAGAAESASGWPLLQSLFPAFFLAALGLAACSEKTPAAQPVPSLPRPNLVLVVLDDADVDLTESMPRFRELFRDRGVSFSSNLANTPLCGPARAELLAGQYAHNTKVYYNNGPEGGYSPWRAGGYDQKNLATWLQAQGYRTGIFGKYMNDFPLGQNEAFVPPGWDDFRVILSDREAHNNRFTLNENGALTVYEASKDGYQTDVLSRRLLDFVRAHEGDTPKPFFAYLALSAPHVPPEPAARHLNAFPGETAPRKPSFDEADLSDKPKLLREQAAPLTRAWTRDIDRTYREMRQSLLSVEEAMDALVRTLTETGALPNTYIFFTSDNGWFRGEHRIPSEKYAPYEESIRVPLYVRGPGVPAGRVLPQVVGLLDLPATLLDLAGAPPERLAALDGRSLRPLILSGADERIPWREAMLIEHFGGGAPYRVRSYSGVRSENDVYVEYASGEKEYYDLRKDPFQLTNTAAGLSAQDAARLSARVAALKNCAGEACRAAEGSR